MPAQESYLVLLLFATAPSLFTPVLPFACVSWVKSPYRFSVGRTY